MPDADRSGSASDRTVVFVCWGNICRSPMAERLAEQAAATDGLAAVRFTSAGVSAEETGRPIDPRAAATLRRLGARTDGHRAHRITGDEARQAELIVCMEDIHAERVLRLDPDDAGLATKVVLLTDFVPGAAPGSGVPDPWYGDQDGFEDTAATISAALPGLFARLSG